MKRLLYIFLGLSLVIIAALIYVLSGSFKDTSVRNADELRNEIAKSIKLPFNGGDTLIVSNVSAICGTGEQPIVFDTQFDQSPYSQTIASQTGMRVIRSNDLIKSDSLSSSFLSGELFAEQVSSKEVIVTESYRSNDSLKSTAKVFSFKGNKWTYIIKRTEALKLPTSLNQ